MTKPLVSAVSIDAARCNGCRACLDSCPTDVFGFDEASNKAILAYPGDCSVCFLCVGDCPTGAIQVDYAIITPRKHSAYESLDPADLALDPSTI